MESERSIVDLEAENQALREELSAALERIETLRARIAELESRRGSRPKGRDDPPPFVKPNRPKTGTPKMRKPREQTHNRSRRRETPTRTVFHALAECPKCQSRLSSGAGKGERLVYRRQVIELPEPRPIEVIEHRVMRRYCPKCRCFHRPKLDLQAAGVVLGRGRIGVRLVSLVAYLRTSLRLPLGEIQGYLATVHQLKLSEGEIVYLLEQVEKATAPEVAALREQMQKSPIVHADETSWRENGQNGYLWSFSTPGGPDGSDTGEAAIRYFERDRSRSQGVLRRILGGTFQGHLVSDFYSGYNDYACPKQRCWCHLLRDLHRDLHELKEDNPKHESALEWAKALRALYDEAVEWVRQNPDPSQAAREQEYKRLVERAHQLGLLHARDKAHPAWALCKRVLRHEDELFQFVRVAGLSPNNNLAERSLRSLVIGRKISGGTRSEKGSKVRMALASLFETWKARGLNPLIECLSLLSRSSAPSPA